MPSRQQSISNVFDIEHGVWKSQKKVSFNIASKASYVYILSGQKLIKNAKNGPPEACGQTVLPDMSLFNRWKIQKFKCDILSDFQTL